MSVPTESLRRRLIGRLLPALFGLIVLGGLASYVVAKRSVDYAYDQALIAAAADVAGGMRVDGDAVQFDLSSQSERILRSDAHDDIYFSVHDEAGHYLGGDRDLRGLAPADDLDGTSTDLRFRGRTLRAMSIRFADGTKPFVVTVAETTSKREAAAWAIFARTIVPTVLVLSLASVLVWLSVRAALRPLDDLRHEIEARSEVDLSPVDVVGAPSEVRSLVGAINRLLGRLDGATKAHQAFLADAAHQLRTPLAGIQTQAELLAAGIDASERPALERLRYSAGRAARLVNQLLALARSDEDAVALRRVDFDLATLIAEAADAWVHRAIDARVDLGFELGRAPVHADPYLLRELLDNLIDNALRHTPADGEITVSTQRRDGFVDLVFDDSGPGVPDASHEAIFERFLRLPDAGGALDDRGSGLGLAIVRQIAGRHDGTTWAERSPTLGGLRLTVRLPEAMAEPAGAATRVAPQASTRPATGGPTPRTTPLRADA